MMRRKKESEKEKKMYMKRNGGAARTRARYAVWWNQQTNEQQQRVGAIANIASRASNNTTHNIILRSNGIIYSHFCWLNENIICQFVSYEIIFKSFQIRLFGIKK